MWKTALVCLGLMCLSAREIPQGDIDITVTGLRNAKGRVLLSLFNEADGFPAKHSKACRVVQLSIEGNKAVGKMASVAAGEYAIALLHDENNDAKMNTNIIGWPKEGFGFSNNAMGVMGPPSFAKAKFIFKGPALHIYIRARYMN